MGADFVLDWDGEKSNEELRDSILHVSWFAFLNIWAAEVLFKGFDVYDEKWCPIDIDILKRNFRL